MSLIPRLSVVMPARNVRPHIDAAVESILGQTFGDFELVIRDDGSTDGTAERLRYWAGRDSRIRLFEGNRLGPAESSNWVVRESRAPFVARMDADDVAKPCRLRRQLDILEGDDGLILVGALSDVIDHRDRRVRGAQYWHAVRRSCFAPFPHTSIAFRRTAFEAVGGYRASCDYWEDLDLYLRLAEQGALAVIAEPLVSYRVSRSSCRMLPADRDRVEAAVDRMYSALESYSAGACYEQCERSSSPGAHRIRPMALLSLQAIRLWAGERPRLLGRLLARGALRLNAETLLTIGWACLGAISPAALRLTLRTLGATRALLMHHPVRRGSVYGWQPHRRSITRRPSIDAASSGHVQHVGFHRAVGISRRVPDTQTVATQKPSRS